MTHPIPAPEKSPHRDRWSARLRGWTEAEQWQRYEDTLLLVLTLLIGAAVGLAVVAFILVTEKLGAWFDMANGPGWHRLATPAAGALLSGLLLVRFFPNARGSGIPQTKVALQLQEGFISLRTVLGKFTCSSLSLASGIALGREGPTVHIGAGIASVLGRRLGLGPRSVRALIPVGTAAALAAAFNTPISAVLFTLEEILSDLHAPVLGSIVISAVTSWAVLHLVLGDEPLFHVPAYQLVHPGELIVYAVLGVLGGLVAVAFVKLLLGLRRRVLQLPTSTRWAQPLMGGLVVGALGWGVPGVLGVGYSHVGQALNDQLVLSTMVVFLTLKVIATASCYASGNAGGIFGPSLFIGAMLGGCVGQVAHAWLPDVTGSPGAYALVGMGTAFAGIIRAPMTSVIMIFEITRDYSIIVPLMVANLLSYFISQRLQPEPVYEALLHQEHIQLPPTRPPLAATTLAHALRPPSVVLDADARIADVVPEARRHGSTDMHAFPVLDRGRFIGMVRASRLDEAAHEGDPERGIREFVVAVGETAPAAFPSVHPDQTVDIALQRMGLAGVRVLPVVSRTDASRLLGMVTLDDLPTAFAGRDGAPPAPRDGTPVKVLLTVVIAGVSGLFLLGVLLAQHYYSVRVESAAAAFRAGTALVAGGRDTEAVERFRSALSLDGRPDYRHALALALARSGRDAEALTYLSEVLRLSPNDGPANLAAARIARAAGETAHAADLYPSRPGGFVASGVHRGPAGRDVRVCRVVRAGGRRAPGRRAVAATRWNREGPGDSEADRPAPAGVGRAGAGDAGLPSGDARGTRGHRGAHRAWADGLGEERLSRRPS